MTFDADLTRPCSCGCEQSRRQAIEVETLRVMLIEARMALYVWWRDRKLPGESMPATEAIIAGVDRYLAASTSDTEGGTE